MSKSHGKIIPLYYSTVQVHGAVFVVLKTKQQIQTWKKATFIKQKLHYKYMQKKCHNFKLTPACIRSFQNLRCSPLKTAVGLANLFTDPPCDLLYLCQSLQGDDLPSDSLFYLYSPSSVTAV